MPTCDPASLEQYRAGRLLESSQRRLAEWKASFYEAENLDAYGFTALEVHLETDPPYVLLCEWDGTSLVERRPGQSERVVEAGYVEKLREAHLTMTPDGWRVEAFATREEVRDQEGALCG